MMTEKEFFYLSEATRGDIEVATDMSPNAQAATRNYIRTLVQRGWLTTDGALTDQGRIALNQERTRRAAVVVPNLDNTSDW